MTAWQRSSEQAEISHVSSQEEAEFHLRTALEGGKHWYVAVLESVALWTLPEETFNGRHYRYLIGGEAFDLPLLVERLCDSLDEFIGADTAAGKERIDYLFHGQSPVSLPQQEFARLLGPGKYSAYLNYWYGVVVEEALQSAVMDEVAKARSSMVLSESALMNAAFRRIYEFDQETLFQEFRKSVKLPANASSSLIEMREFMYWLFKQRVNTSEPARVASDTRKGLQKLDRLRGVDSANVPGTEPNEPDEYDGIPEAWRDLFQPSRVRAQRR